MLQIQKMEPHFTGESHTYQNKNLSPHLANYYTLLDLSESLKSKDIDIDTTHIQ